MGVIKADQLTKEVTTLLYAYSEDFTINFRDESLRIAKKGAKMLKKASRQEFGKGEYSEGWKVDTSGKNHRQLTWSHKIYNEHPGTPHLLEHGHVTRNGTDRTFKDTPAHVHIQPIHDQLIEEYEEYLQEWFR